MHKLRNLERKAPKHAREEIAADFHAIVYAESEAGARAAWSSFEKKWKVRCLAWCAASAKAVTSCSHLLPLPEGAVEDDPHHQRH